MSDHPEIRRLHALSPLLDLAGGVPSIVFLVIVAPGSLTWLPVMAVIGVVLVGFRYVAWSRFSYTVGRTELVVESGVLNRSRRIVPLDRIQQVDVERKVRHRLIGAAVVRIDTAVVGDAAEVVLDAVSDAEAERLRSELHAVATPAAAPEPTAGDREVLRIGAGRLALAGVTGSKLLVVFAATGAVLGFADDVRPSWFESGYDAVAGGARPAVVTVALAAALALPVWLGIAVGASLLTDGGYRMTRRGDVLRVRRGLLDQREASIELHRVQAVWIRENPARRALGLASITIQSAGGSAGGEGADARIEVPIVPRREVDALLGDVLPAAVGPPPLRRAPPAARRRAWVRSVGPAVLALGVVGLIVVAVADGPGRFGAVAAAVAVTVLAVAAIAAELGYRGRAWAATDALVVARRGGLTRTTALVPASKVQSTRLASSTFQRRVGLATLAVDVAGRGSTPRIIDVEGDLLERLRLDALAAPAARRDERAVRRRGAAVTPPPDVPSANGGPGW